jgi:molecular chaperone GrpE
MAKDAQDERAKDAQDESARTPGEGPAPASRAEGVAEPSPSVPPDSAPNSAPEMGEEEEEKVRGLERERDEYLSLARRTKADFENYRKRVGREASEAEARGRASLARGLLTVVDNLERALAAAEPRNEDGAANHIAEGVRLVYEELSGVLANAGVESYEPTGEPFDPTEHEAMMTRDGGPEGAGKVLEVFEKGYRLNGQILRPARVVVGSADDEQLPSAGKPADGSAEG